MPLQSIAMGLVLLLVRVPRDGAYDVVADPVGWVLILIGTAGLVDSARRGPLLALASLGGIAASLLWFPAIREPLVGGDPALNWTANLPQVAFTALLAWELHQRAKAGDAHVPANWFRTATVLIVVVGLLPVVVFGGGVTALADQTYIGAGVSLLLLIGLLFWYAKADWVPQRHRPAVG